MPTLSERTGQLESDARDARSSLDAVALQADDFAQFQKDAKASQAQHEVAVAILRATGNKGRRLSVFEQEASLFPVALKHRLDDGLKRAERSEASIEALLKDVAALKTSSGDLQKRVESWEGRIWGGGLAIVGALVSAVATLVYAILRK